MAVGLQLNPTGMLSTDEGFISSISIRSAGGTVVYTPDASGRIGLTGNALAAKAYSALLAAQRNPIGGPLTPVQGG